MNLTKHNFQEIERENNHCAVRLEIPNKVHNLHSKCGTFVNVKISQYKNH